MEAYYSIIQKENEYRILLTPVNTGVLPEHIQKVLANRKIDISELSWQVIKYQELLIPLYNSTTMKTALDIAYSSIL